MKDVMLGLAAGAAGAVAWAVVVYLTNYEVGWIAWGVGAFVGYAVAYGNADRHRSAPAAGTLAVAITVLSIVAGKYAAVQTLMPSDDEIVAMFAERFEEEEFVVSYVADEVVRELEAAGESVEWPDGVDPQNAASQSDYPAEVWAQAQVRWAGWTEDEQATFREGQRTEYTSRVRESLPELRASFSAGGFAGSFSPMDLIFFGLAMVTAWGVGSGKKSKEQVASEFAEALKLSMLRVIMADGNVDDEEVAVAADVFQQITGQPMTPDGIRADAAVAASGGADLNAALTGLAPHLSEDGRSTVVKAALMVALADGDFAPEEQTLVHGIARAVGLSDEGFRAVVAELSSAAVVDEAGGTDI